MATQYADSNTPAGRNVKLVLEYVDEVWTKMNPSASRRYKTTDFVEHLLDGTILTNLEQFEQWLIAMFKTLKGPIESELQLVVADESHVVMRVRLRLPTPTGAFADKVFVDIFRMHEGLIAEHWTYQ